MQSYLVSLEALSHNRAGRDASELLDMIIGDDRAECLWWFSELSSGWEGWDMGIIIPRDKKVLAELKKAGWDVELTPPGVYTDDSSDQDCVVISEGDIPTLVPHTRKSGE